MSDMLRLRDAVVTWAADGDGSAAAGDLAASLLGSTGARVMVLVEGLSDVAAVETLAARRGRDLPAEGVCVVPLGGVTSIGRFLRLVGPHGLGVDVAGLCDVRELGHFQRALEHEGLGLDGFFVCDADLEDELIRCLGVAGVERVVDGEGERRAYDIFRQQPAQRERSDTERLHRFMGTLGGRKIQYGRALVEALDLDRVPPPLDDLLAYV